MELRGVKEQTALLKRISLRLDRLVSYLQEHATPTKAASRKIRRKLKEVSLFLLDGKPFLVDPIHRKILAAQRILASSQGSSSIFSLGSKEERTLSREDLLRIQKLVDDSQMLVKQVRADLTARYQELTFSKKVRKPKEEEAEELESEEKVQEESPAAATSKKFKDFLESAKDRGWKVTEIKKVVTPEPQISKFDPTYLISQKEVTADLLLDEETDIGLVRVPILISLNNSQTIHNLVQAAQSADVGYTIHHCYSKFYVIDGAICLGLQRSMVRSLDKEATKLGIKRGKPTTFADLLEGKLHKQKLIPTRKLKRRVDIAKFYALIPFLQKEEVMYSDLLPLLSLSTIPYRFGQHYYCPFLPKEIAHDLDFLIESWTFLLKRDQKPVKD